MRALPRDELEAICAHEMGHLWAPDAHWVTSGMVALARARRFGGLIVAVGGALFVLVAVVVNYVEIVLWSTGLVAVALVVLGTLSRTTARRLEIAVRRHADEIADVVAVRLARNPEGFAAACARLAKNPGRVAVTGRRSELLWFEAVETPDAPDALGPHAGRVPPAMRNDPELLARAARARAEAFGAPSGRGWSGQPLPQSDV